MDKNNNKKKVKNVELETRAVRMRDISRQFFTLQAQGYSSHCDSWEPPSDPANNQLFILNLPRGRSYSVRRALAYISDTVYGLNKFAEVGLEWSFNPGIGCKERKRPIESRPIGNLTPHSAWKCYGWLDDWGIYPYNAVIPKGTRGYLFIGSDLNLKTNNIISDDYYNAANEFFRDPYSLSFAFSSVSIVVLQSISQINAFNNTELTPFGSISNLLVPDRFNDAVKKNCIELPRINFDENEIYIINPIPSPIDVWARYCTWVEPIGAKRTLYEFTVGMAILTHPYNIKPTIPNELIENANSYIPFTYSVSDPDGVVAVNGYEVTFKKEGFFKITVTHEFFQSKQYNVGYLKKKLGGIHS